jgi:hypothetical protein
MLAGAGSWPTDVADPSTGTVPGSGVARTGSTGCWQFRRQLLQAP